MPMKTKTTTPISAISPMAVKLALAGSIAFVALVTSLHFIKPEVYPSWQMVSEYEIGDFGWLMQLAFLSLAFGCVSLFTAVRSQIKTTGGKVGLALPLVTAVGLTLAALGTTDPITATKDEMTFHGKVHGFGALLGIPPFPIAATLIALSLSCKQAWASAKRPVF